MDRNRQGERLEDEAQRSRTQRSGGATSTQNEFEQEMEELEERTGEPAVGILDGEEVGTPAGAPNRGAYKGNNQAEEPDPGRYHEGVGGSTEGGLRHGGNT